MSLTRSGRTCQSWSGPKATASGRTATDFPNAGLTNADGSSHSKCRNPDGGAGVWCYTTDPAVRWEYCVSGTIDIDSSPFARTTSQGYTYTTTKLNIFGGSVNVNNVLYAKQFLVYANTMNFPTAGSKLVATGAQRDWTHYRIDGSYGGGGYGGTGGRSEGGHPYGSVVAPREYGCRGSVGGWGGGIIDLQVAENINFRSTPSIECDGYSRDTNNHHYSGGSGGSVYVRAGRISYTGNLIPSMSSSRHLVFSQFSTVATRIPNIISPPGIHPEAGTVVEAGDWQYIVGRGDVKYNSPKARLSFSFSGLDLTGSEEVHVGVYRDYSGCWRKDVGALQYQDCETIAITNMGTALESSFWDRTYTPSNVDGGQSDRTQYPSPSSAYVPNTIQHSCGGKYDAAGGSTDAWKFGNEDSIDVEMNVASSGGTGTTSNTVQFRKNGADTLTGNTGCVPSTRIFTGLHGNQGVWRPYVALKRPGTVKLIFDEEQQNTGYKLTIKADGATGGSSRGSGGGGRIALYSEKAATDESIITVQALGGQSEAVTTYGGAGTVWMSSNVTGASKLLIKGHNTKNQVTHGELSDDTYTYTGLDDGLLLGIGFDEATPNQANNPGHGSTNPTMTRWQHSGVGFRRDAVKSQYRAPDAATIQAYFRDRTTKMAFSEVLHATEIVVDGTCV
jgi:hypothetical protein